MWELGGGAGGGRGFLSPRCVCSSRGDQLSAFQHRKSHVPRAPSPGRMRTVCHSVHKLLRGPELPRLAGREQGQWPA